MFKKLLTIALACIMSISLTDCSSSKENKGSSSSTNTSIKVKTADDFKESDGLVKYIVINNYDVAIPERVGDLASYLEQMGTVTLNDTGKKVEDVTLDAKGISSMVAYLDLETDDGSESRIYVRYENDTNDEISVAEAKITRLEIKNDLYAEQEYERGLASVEVVTDNYTFKMDTKTKLTKFYNEIGGPEQETDGRLQYSDDLGYKYTFDCCNENRTGLFRGIIIEYPENNKK